MLKCTNNSINIGVNKMLKLTRTIIDGYIEKFHYINYNRYINGALFYLYRFGGIFMEISKVGRNTPVRREGKAVSNKKDFSKNFNFAREQKSEEDLKKMLKNIKSKGDRLVISKCYADVRAYKKDIKEYLESVLAFMFSVKKDISFWQTQYFVTVETIDQKLEELTQMLLCEQKDNLDVASTIDEITGLIVDIYR